MSLLWRIRLAIAEEWDRSNGWRRLGWVLLIAGIINVIYSEILNAHEGVALSEIVQHLAESLSVPLIGWLLIWRNAKNLAPAPQPRPVQPKLTKRGKLKLGIVLILVGLGLPVISLPFGSPYTPRLGVLWTMLQNTAVFTVAVLCFFVGLGLLLFGIAEVREKE